MTMDDKTWRKVLRPIGSGNALIHKVDKSKIESVCRLGLLPSERAVQSPSVDVESWGMREGLIEEVLERARPPSYPSRSDVAFLGLPELRLGSGINLRILVDELSQDSRMVIADLTIATAVGSRLKFKSVAEGSERITDSALDVAESYWDSATLCTSPRQCMRDIQDNPESILPTGREHVEILYEGTIPPRAIERCQP